MEVDRVRVQNSPICSKNIIYSEKMKKVGIITHYYQSINYGGNLQAYSLCKILEQQGNQAEQLCFPIDVISLHSKQGFFEKLKQKGLIACGKGFINRCINRFFADYKKKLRASEEKKHNVANRRVATFSEFNQNYIPHSEQVYDKETVKNCVADYDAFITGSDQVWNLSWYNPAYFLDFVPSDKIKISYAASIAMDSLTESQKEIFRKSLKDYKAVSVREESAVKLLEGLSPVPPVAVLDPTLLLSREDWNEICAERVVAEEYLFCYFLGENKTERKLAEQFAKAHNLKLVTIPHAGGGINLQDRKFGDEKLFDVSPQQFISLIKHAKYVFTDSFHAVVFSNIYQKQFFVFNRNQSGTMSSRIKDITKLFHQEERFCAGKERENLRYIQSLQEIDYTKKNVEFEQLKETSLAFLKDNI